MLDDAQVEAIVASYAREELFHSIKTLCDAESERQGVNARLVFWSAFAVLKEGNSSQAIRRLYEVQRRRDMDYPATVALIAAHKSAQLVDTDAVHELEARLKALDEQGGSGAEALLLAAKFQWHVGNSSAARRLVRTLLKTNGQDPQAHALAGWIALTRSGTSSRDQEMRASAIKFFERSLSVAPSPEERSVEALMGKAQFLVGNRQFEPALATLTDAIVLYGAWYRPALIEKARVQLLMGAWEPAHQTVERVIAEEPSNIAALGLAALIALAYRGSAPIATRYLSQLVNAIGSRESHNARAMYAAAMPLARLAGGHRGVLEQTLELVRMATFEQPRSSEFAGEYGHQLMLRGELDRAARVFEEAGGMEESSVVALHGRIEIQLRQGHLKDAAEQLEVFAMIQESIGESAEVSYMKAILLEKQGAGVAAVLPALRHALALHMQSIGQKEGDGSIVPNTVEWFAAFNPSFLTSVARALLRQCDGDGGAFAGAQRLQGDARECLGDVTNLLKHVVELAPGIQPAKLLLARCLLLAQDTARARRLAQSVCSAAHRELLGMSGGDLASSFAGASPGGALGGGSDSGAADTAQASKAYMLLAQIDLADGHHPETLKSLEEALSLNFNIRARPLYHLLKAHVHQARGDLETARSILQDALELPGVRTAKAAPAGRASAASSKRTRFAGAAAPASGESSVSSGDRVAVFTRLATVLAHLGRLGEADLIVAEALTSFQGTPLEVHIVVVKAEVAIKRGQVDKAMRYLKRVRADSPAYVKAQLVKAAVFLKQRRNKRKYIACYQELLDSAPTKQSHILMGEANMRIQEPDAAIRAFEAALALDPEDALLATRVGEALVSTHDYDRAIEYYKTALRASPRKHALRHQLALLYAKLAQHDAAAALLQAAVGDTAADDAGEAGEPAVVAFQRARTLGLLADVHLAHSKRDAEEGRRSARVACPPAKEALERAQAVATRALRHLQAGGLASSDRQLEARELAASACYKLGVYSATNEKDDENAVAQYTLALQHDEAHEAAMLALAKACVAAGRMEEGREQCLRLLKMSDAHIDAASLLADIMLQEGNLDQATLHFQRILEKRPAEWQSLSRVTLLLWRTGRIAEVPARLRAAKKSSPHAANSAGFHYCCGVYHRCAHDPAKAVRAFNLARRDGEWGFNAVSSMVEIYLGVGVGGTLSDLVLAAEGGGVAPSVFESISVAEALMQEPVMLSKQSTPGYRILAAFVAICRGERSRALETATRDVMQLYTEDKTNVAALLAACCGLLVNKSEGKAKNNLKRIYKMPYNESYHESFEQAWLLLAVIYMKAGKQSNAQGLCQKCVQYNQSCSKAFELLGEINERSLAYRDAAEAYQQAFKFGHELSAEVGFKLAFNYLKADQYTKAIDVCHKVLAAAPEFPRIREEILVVARKAVRT